MAIALITIGGFYAYGKYQDRLDEIHNEIFDSGRYIGQVDVVNVMLQNQNQSMFTAVTLEFNEVTNQTDFRFVGVNNE